MLEYLKMNTQSNVLPLRAIQENIKLQLLKILRAGNSDDSGVNSGLGLLLNISGYKLLLKVDKWLKNHNS